jgi:lipopolysaccharide transport system ATP-binding protein
VGSLLEVGTGFHPELTGRENIFLNGAILGMKRREIAAKFDQIVEFAGVGKFLDTPVKHYSSGMYVRLAFSVAAHMEPDILLIDEVLAVGDAEFQQKCLGKMDEITRTEGRTILFVSHNLQAIERLCERTVVLDHGRVAFVGETGEAIALYTRSMSARSGEEDLRGRHDRRGTGNVRLTKVSFYDPAGKPVSRAVAGEPLVVGLSYESQGGKPLENCQVNFSWKSAGGQGLFVCSSDLTHPERFDLPPSGEVRCKIPRFPLGKGVYTLGALFRVNMQIEDWVLNAATLECESGDFYGKGSTAAYWPGESVMVEHEWLI